MSQAKQTILLVDSDPDFLQWAKHQLENPVVRVLTETASDTAFKTFGLENPDLVLADLYLHPASGLELLARIRKASPHAMVIITSAYGSNQGVIESMKLGAFDFVRKEQLPFSLKAIVDAALKERAEQQAAAPFKPVLTVDEHKDEIVGKSEAMQQVFKMIGRVAGSEAPIMITGESGSGKELVARAVHHYSHRSDRAFLAINCAAIPEALLESELFGHEKGAFTGAHSQRIGRFEQADKGTLFLDEIGEMPLATQSKLLRVLQEGEFSRVGGNETLKTDVRIIAATNRNLEKEVEVGRFREDLFYRLNVVRVHLPPLRERPEDIPLLARFFVDRLAKKKNNPRLRLSEDAYSLMESYNWPGNVRELENTIQRATVLANTDVLTARDIPLGLGIAPRPEATLPTAAPSLTNESAIQHLMESAITLGESPILWIERQLAEEALRRDGQDHAAAARRLGLKPAAFKKLVGAE